MDDYTLNEKLSDGIKFYTNGRYEEAVKCFKEITESAFEIIPDKYIKALYNQATTNLKLKNFKEAVKLYDNCLRFQLEKKLGKNDKELLLKEDIYNSLFNKSLCYFNLYENDNDFEYLKKSYLSIKMADAYNYRKDECLAGLYKGIMNEYNEFMPFGCILEDQEEYDDDY